MKLIKFAVLACLCIIGYLPIGYANADQFVQFDSAAIKPSPLRERKAKEAGETLTPEPTTHLQGYLTRPQGAGPFPAIVLLHGCAGIIPAVKDTWPERLSSWGYVVLVVDSFTTRGIKDTCHHLLPDRVYDAYGALDFLSKYSFVDADRTALMGFSAGGIATLDAEHLGAAERLMDRNFKAAVAYYPLCSATGDMAVPTLILAGELDDWSPAMRCQNMMDHRTGQGSSVQLNVYQGARHGFDISQLKTQLVYDGHLEEYNAEAAGKSINDVRSFLQKTLGK
jgi:dienelactone hydrolase